MMGRIGFIQIISALVCMVSLLVTVPGYAYAQTGAEIRNTAFVTVDAELGNVTFPTNEVVLTIEAARTESTIEFFRFAPAAGNGIVANINGSQFSPSGDLSGPFVDIGAPVTSNGLVLDLSGDVMLSPATRFLTGELLFLQVVDPGQNSSASIIETLSVSLTASTGDEITLRLFESGPDTGVFIAFVPSSPDPTEPNDNVLSTPEGTELTATYVDFFDSSDISVDTAVIEPSSRVFDSMTGDLLDGVIVTVIDQLTGQPADVWGVDGISRFPSTIETGSTVTDESGLEYPLGPGEFLFPIFEEGTYELRLETPDGFAFASALDPNAFGGLENGPFLIVPGSFGESFAVSELGPLNFDVPLDSVGELVVT